MTPSLQMHSPHAALQGVRLSCRLSGRACMLGAGPTALQRQRLLCAAGLGGLGSWQSWASFATGCAESPGAPQSSCSRCTCSCRSRRWRPGSTRNTSSGSRSSCSCSPCCGALRGPAPAPQRRLRPPAALKNLSCDAQTPCLVIQGRGATGLSRCPCSCSPCRSTPLCSRTGDAPSGNAQAQTLHQATQAGVAANRQTVNAHAQANMP